MATIEELVEPNEELAKMVEDLNSQNNTMSTVLEESSIISQHLSLEEMIRLPPALSAQAPSPAVSTPAPLPNTGTFFCTRQYSRLYVARIDEAANMLACLEVYRTATPCLQRCCTLTTTLV